MTFEGKTYSFYAHYFHPISLNKKGINNDTANLSYFNEDDHDALKLQSETIKNIIEQRINGPKGLKKNDVLKSEGSQLLIPLRGELRIPSNSNNDKVPLVIIGHGQAAQYIEGKEVLSYKGYEVLQAELEKNNIASYSINLNMVNLLDDGYIVNNSFDYHAIDNNQRILVFFLHLMLLKELSSEPDLTISEKNPIRVETNNGLKSLDEPALQELKDNLRGRFDFKKLGFIGHSRGADTVSRISAYFYKGSISPGPTYSVNNEVDSRIRNIVKLIGEPSQDFIKSILALEPVSQRNPDTSEPDTSKRHGYVIDNKQTMYFVVSSTHDEDVTLDSIRIYEYPNCPKAMIVLKNATHAYFNSIWRKLKKIKMILKKLLVMMYQDF